MVRRVSREYMWIIDGVYSPECSVQQTFRSINCRPALLRFYLHSTEPLIISNSPNFYIKFMRTTKSFFICFVFAIRTVWQASQFFFVGVAIQFDFLSCWLFLANKWHIISTLMTIDLSFLVLKWNKKRTQKCELKRLNAIKWRIAGCDSQHLVFTVVEIEKWPLFKISNR